jgi:glycosyltransferase involved in cell wall biosynthesis
MRILAVTGRFPVPGGKGDQSRLYSFLLHLAPRHELVVVSGTPAPSPQARRALEALAEVHADATPALLRALSAANAAQRGRAGQSGWMLPARPARLARRLAAEADAVLVETIRALPPGVDRHLVLDHVDALSLNMRRRARGGEALPVRLAAAVEARLLARMERAGAAVAAAQVVTAREDAAHLPPHPAPVILPVGWDGPIEPGEGPRDVDLIFTGNMAYPPNREAARRIDARILPLIRRRRPQARAWVVGRGAGALGLSSVEVASDVPDLHAWLRRAKVALVPLSGGTGSPYKVLEAAACGAAVLSRGWAADVFGMETLRAETDEEFAARALELLEDEGARAAWAAKALPAVERHTGAAMARRLEELLELAAAQPD